jgi:hypothetical protein
MFWSIVGQASFHTVAGMGPSTIERSKALPRLGGADLVAVLFEQQ